MRDLRAKALKEKNELGVELPESHFVGLHEDGLLQDVRLRKAEANSIRILHKQTTPSSCNSRCTNKKREEWDDTSYFDGSSISSIFSNAFCRDMACLTRPACHMNSQSQ